MNIGGGTVRAALCARAYKRFPGLYDLQLRFVSVNSTEEGLVGRLTLSGVDYDLGLRFTRQYLESLAWRP